MYKGKWWQRRVQQKYWFVLPCCKKLGEDKLNPYFVKECVVPGTTLDVSDFYKKLIRYVSWKMKLYGFAWSAIGMWWDLCFFSKLREKLDNNTDILVNQSINDKVGAKHILNFYRLRDISIYTIVQAHMSHLENSVIQSNAISLPSNDITEIAASQKS